jgi:hypothetical protein
MRIFLLAVATVLIGACARPTLDPSVRFVATGGEWREGTAGGTLRVVVEQRCRQSKCADFASLEWLQSTGSLGSQASATIVPIREFRFGAVRVIGPPLICHDSEGATMIELFLEDTVRGSSRRFLVWPTAVGEYIIETSGLTRGCS